MAQHVGGSGLLVCHSMTGSPWYPGAGKSFWISLQCGFLFLARYFHTCLRFLNWVFHLWVMPPELGDPGTGLMMSGKIHHAYPLDFT